MFNTQIAVDEFARLQKLYGFQTCFETGTHRGVGALGASEFCPMVATVEIDRGSRGECVKKFEESGYVRCDSAFEGFENMVFHKGGRTLISMLGKSPEAMRWYLERSDLDAPFCFYLDAHWDPNDWPLRPELQVIADFKLSNSVIIIHDAKVPQEWEMNNYGYDTYNGQALDYDYVKDLLAKINPNYKIAYNKGGGPRGILYALP